VNIGY